MSTNTDYLTDCLREKCDNKLEKGLTRLLDHDSFFSDLIEFCMMINWHVCDDISRKGSARARWIVSDLNALGEIARAILRDRVREAERLVRKKSASKGDDRT